MPPYVSSRAVPFQLSVYVARALVPVPMGPRRPTELHENPCAIDVAQALQPAASRLFGTLLAASCAGAREGVFEAAASALLPTPVGRTADKAGVHATSGTRHLAMR